MIAAKHTRAIKRILTALLCAALLAGCGGQTEPEPEPAPAPTPAPTEETPEQPMEGGVMRLSMRLPKTLNPLLNEDATVDSVLRLVFEPLFELDASQRAVGRLAESVNLASDGMSAIITLKSGLHWADGEEITARDAEYSLGVLQDAPERAVYKDCIRNVSGWSVLDDHNIKLNYYQPFGGSASLLCFPLIPMDFYSTGGDALDTALGSGLYRVTGFERQEQLTLTAGQNAFGKRPYISEVQALVTSDRETDLSAFEQGLTDLVRVDIANYGKLANAREISAWPVQTAYFDFIGFNFAKPILQDQRVRMAIAYAVDKPKLLNDVYLNYGVTVDAPIDAESWLYEPNTTHYDFDLEKSTALLNDAGVRVLRVLVNEENEERLKIASMLRDNLEQAGVSIGIEQEPFAEYERRLADGDFDLVVAGFNLNVTPELTFAFGTDAERNYFSYTSPIMDGLLSDMFSAVGENAYRRAAGDLQKFFADELPCISLVFRRSVVLTGNIRGELSPTIANPFVDMEHWYIQSAPRSGV